MQITYLALFGNFIQNDVTLYVLMVLRLKTPRILKGLLHVDWYFSKDPIAFIFGIKTSDAWPWRRRNEDPWKRRPLFKDWQRVISQKTWNIQQNLGTTSNLAILILFSNLCLRFPKGSISSFKVSEESKFYCGRN